MAAEGRGAAEAVLLRRVPRGQSLHLRLGWWNGGDDVSDQGPVDSREIRVECPFCRGAGKVAPAAEFATGGIMSDHRARIAALEAERDEAKHALAKEAGVVALVQQQRDDAWKERDALRSRLAEVLDTLDRRGIETFGQVWDDARAAAERRGEGPSCLWTLDDIDAAWDTGCGNRHVFTDGGPAENGQRFCGYCGRPLCEVTRGEDPA